MKKLSIISLVLIIALILSGCGSAAAAETAPVPAMDTAPAVVPLAAPIPAAAAEDDGVAEKEMFTARDLRGTYDTPEAIELSDSGIKTASTKVAVSGTTAVIGKEGVYLLSGTLTDGMIIVDADSSEKVQLVLAGVSITSKTSAAIYVRQADKVFITLANGSKNTLANGGGFTAIDEYNIGAAVYSRDDLTLNGSGALTIMSPAGKGVDCKDDLVITGGTYDVTAAGHGFDANDSIRVAGGSITVTSGGDGLHAENNDDPAEGFVYIENGGFDLTSDGDGISAGSWCLIADGTFAIVTGGGSANAEMSAGDDMMMGRGMAWASQEAAEETAEQTGDGIVSAKGIKAADTLTVEGDTFVMDTLDDAVHSNTEITVSSGKFSVMSGDDGFHADDTLTVSGGVIEVGYSYEGLEASKIELTGGDIAVTAMDDGINAGGGMDGSGMMGMRGMDTFAASGEDGTSGTYLSISGGTVYVNCGGDGLDANGSLFVTGGDIIVSGPERTGNSALDYDAQGVISGGTLIATMPASMAMNFSAASTQGSIMTAVDTQQAGTEISLKDAGGKELLRWTADKSFSVVVFSSPEITVGETYTVTAGSFETQVTPTSLVFGAGGMGGMGGGKMGGGRGAFMGG